MNSEQSKGHFNFLLFGIDFCWFFAAAQEAPTTPLAQLREKMTNSCVNILYTYRKFCATASSSGQLILPEALKLLPLYTLGILA